MRTCNYHKFGCNMSLKIKMLHSHLGFFPDKRGMVGDEHGELFMRKLQRERKDIRKGGPLPCWTLVRNAPEQLHKRQAARSRKKKRTFIVTCPMYRFLKYIINVCGFLGNRSQF